MKAMERSEGPRTSEWFVPSRGPVKLRSFLGLLFLPYTGMVLSFLVLGAILAPRLYWDRLVALEIVYFLALGIGAHALDAVGSGGARPWGSALRRGQLWALAIGSLAAAYALAAYYMVRYVPLLWPMAVLEGFFVFAYNMEWFHGRFHSDGWFAFSWGFLPVLAGYIMQTNRIAVEAFFVGGATGFFSIVEIKASRPYKLLRQGTGIPSDEDRLSAAKSFEAILKGISIGVILLAVGLLVRQVSM